jgi:hypothetical protein
MLQVSFFCQIGEGIIFVSGERSPTIIFFGGRILDQLFEYKQIKREAEFGARLLWSPTGGDD